MDHLCSSDNTDDAGLIQPAKEIETRIHSRLGRVESRLGRDRAVGTMEHVCNVSAQLGVAATKYPDFSTASARAKRAVESKLSQCASDLLDLWKALDPKLTQSVNAVEGGFDAVKRVTRAAVNAYPADKAIFETPVSQSVDTIAETVRNDVVQSPPQHFDLTLLLLRHVES